MAQSIKIKVAGKEYPFQVTSEEAEHYMRLAAEDVNDTLGNYSSRFPDKELADKLVFVALIEAIGKLKALKKLDTNDRELKSLGSALRSYLDSVSK
ncbi:MAG: cell division protein ZapA [Bacteroidales bacterium]|nr:cell division protein ZapA [Bacteroidales bacterium]